MAKASKTTQDFIPIKEIREGVVILKDGSLRRVIMSSAINLALKNPDEQIAVLYQFQNFLNSLDFSVQIFIQSRRMDINPYLDILRTRQNKQTNELIKIQTAEYIEFVERFTEDVSIMTKNFFVIVPYTPAIVSIGKKQTEKKGFSESRTQLEQRLSIVEQGLSRTGVRTVRMGTEELVELFYKLFNPGDTTVVSN